MRAPQRAQCAGVGPAAGTRRVRSLARASGLRFSCFSGIWAPQGPPVGAGRRRPLPRPSSQVRARYSLTARPRAPEAGDSDSEPGYLPAGRARPGPGAWRGFWREFPDKSGAAREPERGEAVGMDQGVFVSHLPDPMTLGRFGQTWWAGAVAGVAP